MFRIETRGDLIYYLVLWTLVTAMGVLLLVFPPVPLPADPAAYEQRAGALESITQRHAVYQSAWVRFRIANEQAPRARRARAKPRAPARRRRARLAASRRDSDHAG